MRHALLLQRLANREAAGVRRLLAEVEPDVIKLFEQRIVRTARRGVDWGPVTTKRLRDFKVALAELLKPQWKTAERTLRENLRELAMEEARLQLKTIQRAAPVKLDMELPDVSQLRAIVTTRPFAGKLLNEWFDNLNDSTQANIMSQIRIGLVEGETIDQMARRLRGTRAGGYMDGVLPISRRNAEAVVRTATNHTSNAARALTYEENAEVIKGVQVVATLDTRTTPICQDRDGEVYPVDSGPRPPFHVNCRTTTAPVLKSWEELGIPLAEAKPSTRASMDGQVSEKLKYPDWLNQQSDAVKRQVLGRERFKLHKEGVPVDKFIADGRRLTLAELRAKTELLDAFDDTADDKMAIARDPKQSIETRLKNYTVGDAKIAAFKELRKKNPDKYTKPQAELKALVEELKEMEKGTEELRKNVRYWKSGKYAAAATDNVVFLAYKKDRDLLDKLDKQKTPIKEKIIAKTGTRIEKEKPIEKRFESASSRQQLIAESWAKTFSTDSDLQAVFAGEGYNFSVKKPQPGKRNKEALGRIEEVFDWYSAAATFDTDKYSWPLEIKKDKAVPVFTVKISEEFRASARSARRTINIDYEDTLQTIAHEIGHILEYDSRTAAVAFREYRLKGKTPYKFKEAWPTYSYDPDEIGHHDDFLKLFKAMGFVDPKREASYAGKVYDGLYTELTSMGIEVMWEDFYTFLDTDEEFFKFILGVLDGTFNDS